ncbi:MAG TPA: hypothetical protein VNM48_02905 [Chloroflexota bacterium]|nr:hypothetical protein [Chloroflexota bacterium]
MIDFTPGVTTARVSPAWESGRFYLIRPDPRDRPTLVKMGFTNSPVPQRLYGYRKQWPRYELVQAWNVYGWWERACIAAVTYQVMTQAWPGAREWFECDDLDALVKRIDSFFLAVPSTDMDWLLVDRYFEEQPAVRQWHRHLFRPLPRKLADALGVTPAELMRAD